MTGSTQQVNQTMSLLTTTTGFVDVYVIAAFEQLPWIVPQSLVLAALSAKADMREIEWREDSLPILSLVKKNQDNPVALVLESYHQLRFALLIEKMPEAQRVRISSLHDVNVEAVSEAFNYQVVKMQDQHYQIPDFEKINQSLFKQKSQSTQP